MRPGIVRNSSCAVGDFARPAFIFRESLYIHTCTCRNIVKLKAQLTSIVQPQNMVLDLVPVEISVFSAQVRWIWTRVLSRRDDIPHENSPNLLSVMQELEVQVCTWVEGIIVG